jgi:hypothetical protein
MWYAIWSGGPVITKHKDFVRLFFATGSGIYSSLHTKLPNSMGRPFLKQIVLDRDVSKWRFQVNSLFYNISQVFTLLIQTSLD